MYGSKGECGRKMQVCKNAIFIMLAGLIKTDMVKFKRITMKEGNLDGNNCFIMSCIA